MRELCAELGPDDGMSPHDLKKLERRRRPPTRLAGQIKRALSLALGAASDPCLAALWVVSVTADPDPGRFRIEVQLLDPALAVPPEIVEAHLAAARGWLRTEVAGAIRRRRAPDLVFVCLPPGGDP